MISRKFQYNDLKELQADIQEGRYDIPTQTDISPLTALIAVSGRLTKNAMAIHPMEGCDAGEDGSPEQLTLRRYQRYAAGGAGLIWVEATAISSISRANGHQLWLHENNTEAFRNLVKTIRDSACGGQPYVVLQLTHSGRFSSTGSLAQIGQLNPYLDRGYKNYHELSDKELVQIEDQFAAAASYAKQAGFDAVDIKACHCYLLGDLLSCYRREGLYGGSFENRTRLLRNIVQKVKKQVDITIAVRLNAFDEIDYPYGFGVDREDCRIPDFTEAKQLASLLAEAGASLLSVSGSTPYLKPHINRPYDNGPYPSPMPQLDSIHKLLTGAKAVKSAVPQIPVIACGFSWLREYAANVAAGGITQGYFDMMGMGRQGFAYPDFPNDIQNGGMRRGKCCVTCSKCSELMRAHTMTGCIVRDPLVYAPLYKNFLNQQNERRTQ